MYKLLVILLAVIIISCAQKQEESEYPVGEKSWIEWQNEADWMFNYALDYFPDYSAELEKKIADKNYSFILFAASWCPDCEFEVPRVFRLFRLHGQSSAAIKLIGVDNEKNDGIGMMEKYNVKKVPTFLVLKNGKEIGRITEHPDVTLRDDLLSILK